MPILDEAVLKAVAERIAPLGNERKQKLDSFARGLRELNERWDNRFLPEGEDLREAYVKGRFEIAIHGYVASPLVERHWLLRIKPTVHELDARFAVDDQIDLTNGSALRRYDQLVVLVDTVKEMQVVEKPL